MQAEEDPLIDSRFLTFWDKSIFVLPNPGDFQFATDKFGRLKDGIKQALAEFAAQTEELHAAARKAYKRAHAHAREVETDGVRDRERERERSTERDRERGRDKDERSVSRASRSRSPAPSQSPSDRERDDRKDRDKKTSQPAVLAKLINPHGEFELAPSAHALNSTTAIDIKTVLGYFGLKGVDSTVIPRLTHAHLTSVLDAALVQLFMLSGQIDEFFDS